MADNKASFIIELKDFVSGGIGSISAKLAILRQGWLAVTSVVNQAIAVFQDVLSSYSEQETAVNKLNQALINQGINSIKVSKDIQTYASELQKTTVYADEVIIQNQALLVTFGLMGDKLNTATKAALDLATGMNIDLRTATLLVGKASAGATETLARYGIKISETIPQGEKFAAVLDAINNRFGGSAQAQTDTYSGKLLQLKNTFDELKESIGTLLVGPASDLVKWLGEAVGKLTEYTNAYMRLRGPHQQMLLQWKTEIDTKEALLIRSAKYYETHEAERKQVEDRISALKKATEFYLKEGEAKALSTQASRDKVAAETEETLKLQEKAQVEIDSYTLTQDQIAEKRNIALAKELEANNQHALSMQVLNSKRTADDKKQQDLRAANFASTLNTISTLATSNNNTLATIGKAAAISSATIDTYAAANKALASAPPPYNYALAALVTAAGIANVAKISGVKLAAGGMIMPSNGGTLATMAEAGKAEVAIPLDDERTKEKLRDTFGGAGHSIIIQAGTIVADDYSLSQFAQKLDEKLFELQRNGRSYR